MRLTTGPPAVGGCLFVSLNVGSWWYGRDFFFFFGRVGRGFSTGSKQSRGTGAFTLTRESTRYGGRGAFFQTQLRHENGLVLSGPRDHDENMTPLFAAKVHSIKTPAICGCMWGPLAPTRRKNSLVVARSKKRAQSKVRKLEELENFESSMESS